MVMFDVSKYQVPEPSDVDIKLTKKNFEIFMSAYGAAREKVGKNRMPKMTQSFNPVSSTPHREYSGDAERFLIEREMFMPEYNELHDIFGVGYLAISNFSREGATERRRQIFMLRYVYGLGVQSITERTYLGKTAVIEESKMGLIQFCNATDLLVSAAETKPMIEMVSKSNT